MLPPLGISPALLPEFVAPCLPDRLHPIYGNLHFAQTPLFYRSPALLAQPGSNPPSAADSQVDLDVFSAAVLKGDSVELAMLLDTVDVDTAVNKLKLGSGLSPLHVAASKGFKDVVCLLIDKAGALVDLSDKDGETALLKAAYHGYSDVVSELISRKADVNATDRDGWTALHNASSRGYYNVVKNLLDGGALINVVNAAAQGHISIVNLLLAKGANPLLQTAYGDTAYDLASQNEQASICEMIESAEIEFLTNQTLANVGEFNPQEYHNTALEIIHENQRSSSILNASESSFSSKHLLRSDSRGPFSTVYGKPMSLDEILLPVLKSGDSNSLVRGWFWLTDWKVDENFEKAGKDGWSYARSFEETEDNWLKEHASGMKGVGSWVRRRRWIRVRKRRLDVEKCEKPELGELHEFAKISEVQVEGYVSRARRILNEGSNRRDALDHAIQILLVGMKNDHDEGNKRDAKILVTMYLDEAESLNDELGDPDSYIEPTVRNDTHSNSSPRTQDVPQESSSD
ncbi:hypothetical protein HK096_002339, partial [Nowakowskiella sp. JEL0078]